MGELISGANFSGRSAMLRDRLQATAPTAFFIGPHAEAALSGLSSRVADEIAIYQTDAPTRPAFAPLDFAGYAARKPPTLSGGEQVLLALYCFSRSGYRAIGIDTALEQLDPENRDDALSYLSREDIDTVLTDNRLNDLDFWFTTKMPTQATPFACDLPAATAKLSPIEAPAIAIDGLTFGYPGGRDIFQNASIDLAPASAYRLIGSNGAGKTTLFKLLAGVLAPQTGTLSLAGKPYAPWHEGNRLFALAAQNPDHQWCGATLREDVARRRKALARHVTPPDEAALHAVAARLGVAIPDQHLYELPLVVRKRLSWLWPLSGALPWIMLDEPTIGQDRATRTALAAAIGELAARGHGVLFITHDDDFAAAVTHQKLRIADGAIQLG
jgi:energy-coupling factor transporter ATP-binding protein EcfA2